jgi:hypothetical protein
MSGDVGLSSLAPGGASLAFDTPGSEAALALDRHVLVAIEEKRRRLGSPVLSTAEANLLISARDAAMRARCPALVHAAMRARCPARVSLGVMTRIARPEV